MRKLHDARFSLRALYRKACQMRTAFEGDQFCWLRAARHGIIKRKCAQNLLLG